MNYLQIRWRHLLALSLILLCSVSALFARPLSEREARHLAEQFFHQVAYAHKVLAPAQQPLSLVSAPIRQSAYRATRLATTIFIIEVAMQASSSSLVMMS